MLLLLIWRNAWRNKRRTLITMTSVLFAVTLAVLFKSLQTGVFDNLVNNVVRFYSGYIQIHKAGYWDEQVLDNSFELNDTLERVLQKESMVKMYAPRVESYALVSSGDLTRGCMIVGTNPDKESLLTSLDKKVISGEYFPHGSVSALIGEGLAGNLKVKVNDTIIILGQGYHGASAAGKFPISAIAHFGSPELNETLLFMPLKNVQDLFSTGNLITSLAVDLKEAGALPEVQQYLRNNIDNRYEVMTWADMMPEIDGHIKADTIGFYIEIGILYLVIAFGIFGTMLMMMSERKYEFGMLLAIGMKKNSIALMLIGEIVLVTILGTIAGMIISYPIVYFLSVHPIRFGGSFAEAFIRFGFEPIFPAAIRLSVFIEQALAVLIISLCIGLIPVLIIHRTNPVNAMKR